jgi:hypothetical protein
MNPGLTGASKISRCDEERAAVIHDLFTSPQYVDFEYCLLIIPHIRLENHSLDPGGLNKVPFAVLILDKCD